MCIDQRSEDRRRKTEICRAVGAAPYHPARSADNHLPPVFRPLSSERGISLIELVMFIVIISIAMAGILLVMNNVIRHSADALVRKQALSIAESFLEEIQLQGISGVNASTGSANADRTTFDNVFNYHNYFTTGGVKAMDGATVVPGLSGYNVASVVIPIPVALGNIPALSASAVMITVTVSDPSNQTLAATGYRAGN